jgi:hypothetical protein
VSLTRLRYWATEHGGIVWSRCFGSSEQPLAPDARSWPLPWIDGAVRVADRSDDGELSGGAWHDAEAGEKGDVVISQQYPYLALTVWASGGFGTSAWRGDLTRWSGYFPPGAGGYVQGDAAVRHADGAYTFHGRSDEVMNVGGNRVGTAEIESAILLDRSETESPLLNCAVAGMDDTVLGSVPCAFLVLQPQYTELPAIVEGRLRKTVREQLSGAAVPSRFIVVPALPETYSGKYMRRILRAALAGEPLGDVGTLRNPECLEPLCAAVVSAIGVRAATPHQAAEPTQAVDCPESVILDEDVGHPFVQRRLRTAQDGAVVFRAPAEGALRALIVDHVIQGRVLFPGAGYMEVARAAVCALTQTATGAALQRVFFLQPLVVDAPGGLHIECVLYDSRFDVRSGELDHHDPAELEGATVHCSGGCAAVDTKAWLHTVDFVPVRGRVLTLMTHVSKLYDDCHAMGLMYGPDYRTLDLLWGVESSAIARQQTRSAWHSTHVHPADLDDAIVLALTRGGPAPGSGETAVPFAVDSASIDGAPGAPGELWAVRAPHAPPSAS